MAMNGMGRQAIYAILPPFLQARLTHRFYPATLIEPLTALLAVFAIPMNDPGEKPLLIWRYIVVTTPAIITIVLIRHIRYARRKEKIMTHLSGLAE